MFSTIPYFHGANFFCYRKFKGSNSPPPIAHITFQQNLRCVQYGFDSGNYVMYNSYTSHRRWWGMVSRILTSCCQFVENILFSSLIYSRHIFGNKLILVRTLSFLFSLLEILATTFENTLSKKTSIEKRGKNVILRKLRNVNHELCTKAGVTK